MNRHAAFTLLEVLIALVLLALVVAVCAPYLRPAMHESTTTGLSSFVLQVNEHINRFKLSHADQPTIEELTDLLSPIGYTCTSTSSPSTENKGRWISITDGDYTVLRWAHSDPVLLEELP